MRFHQQKRKGFGLTELLVTIAIIGVLSAVSFPTVSKIYDASEDAKARVNARNLESMSADLAALGVAHVIPDSLGGVEATARLIRTGVIVPEGPMAGAVFRMAALTDDDITSMTKYLRVVYHKYELGIEFSNPSQKITFQFLKNIPENLASLRKSTRLPFN